MILFERTDPIARHRSFTREHAIEWYAWSDVFLKEKKMLKQQLSKLKGVDFVYVKGYDDYNYTYNVTLNRLDKGFVEHFKNYVYDLYHINTNNRILFFRDLISDEVNGRLFHFIFSLFRALLVKISRDEMGALYSPLTAGKDQDDFPLHCDLYIPRTLFNVMENVAKDNSGHSTFMLIEMLEQDVLPGVSNMSNGTRHLLMELIRGDLRVDNYERFFNTLYDKQWAADVKKLQRQYRMKIRLAKGEGYMLNDRIWMHGRDRTNGGITKKRLHRLIFNSFWDLTNGAGHTGKKQIINAG